MKHKIRYGEAFAFMRRLFQTMGREKRKYWLGSMMAALEMLNSILIPFVFQKMVQMVSQPTNDDIHDMTVLMALLLVVLLVAPVISLGDYMYQKSSTLGKNNLRTQLFDHIQKLSVSDIKKRDTGEYITLLSNDVERAYGLIIGYGFRSCYQFLVILPVTAVILLYYCPEVAAPVVLVSLLIVWFSSAFNPKVSRLGQEAQKEMGASAGPLIEVFSGYSIVRVFGCYQWMWEKFREICGRIFRKRVRYRTINGIVDSFLNFFQTATQPFTFMFALTLVLGGHYDVATAVLVSGIASVLADKARGVGTFIANMQPQIECARRIFEVMDLPEEPMGVGIRTESVQPGSENAVDLQALAIQVKNIAFSYSKTKEVLHNFSCEIKKGEIVVLTGPSGCGKSTLFQLIQAMYEPDAGEILYFGRSGKNMMRREIREMIAYVPQECSVFEGSIAYNIRLGKQTADMEEVRLAACNACLDQFISSLPNGYETAVGEKGAQLSGGQRQRIAIARAFLKDAPILLLDEATSALDAESEHGIWDAMHNLMKGRTVLMISHHQLLTGDREICMDWS